MLNSLDLYSYMTLHLIRYFNILMCLEWIYKCLGRISYLLKEDTIGAPKIGNNLELTNNYLSKYCDNASCKVIAFHLLCFILRTSSQLRFLIAMFQCQETPVKINQTKNNQNEVIYMGISLNAQCLSYNINILSPPISKLSQFRFYKNCI